MSGTLANPDVRQRLADTQDESYKRMLKLESVIKEHQPPANVSPTDIPAWRASKVESIFGEFTQLGNVLDCYEQTIRRRWTEKTRKQRCEILLPAWGTMAPNQRPDWDLVDSIMKRKSRGSRSDQMAALMWPYINQEDLTKPRNLLLFLASRGRNHPAMFATADLEAMYLGVSIKLLYAGHLAGYTMVFSECDDPKDYGELVNTTVRQNLIGAPLVSQGVSVNEGMLILNAQHSTLKFLNNCARLILHDLSTLEKISFGPVVPAPSLPQEKDVGFASLAIMAAEAPYRLPAQLDFDRLVSLLTAKRYQTADHLWSLREDPGYFADYLNEVHEHRAEMLLDVHGLPHPDLEAKNRLKYWTRVLWDIVITDYMKLEMFAELQRQAEALRQMHQSNTIFIHPERDLPEPFMHAILRFRYFLKEAAMITWQTRLPVFGSKPWRDHFSCTDLNDQVKSVIYSARHPCQLDDIQVRLRDYLVRFASHKDRHSANHEHSEVSMLEMKMYGMTTIMDGLQHLIESEPRAKAMITPFIAESLGEAAILSECLHQLEIYQPWARTFDTILTEDLDKAFQSDYTNHTKATEHQIIQALTSCGLSLGRLGAPIEDKFSYPIEEPRTEETVANLRKAESNLDAFWNKVNTAILNNLGPVKRTAIHRFLTQPQSVQRTANWIRPTKSKASSGSQILHPSFAELELECHTKGTTPRDVLSMASKVKTKTRRSAIDSEPQAPVGEVSEHAARVRAAEFAVDARALGVFKTLFFSPDMNTRPAPIKWARFLHAMVSVGLVPEKLYGSVWHFRPTRPGLGRSINFHEPHKPGQGSGKIAYSNARLIGGRLSRAYGWDGSSFSLAEE